MTSTMVRLDEVCDIQIGRTPSRSVPRYWGKGHPWLSIADMSQGRDLIHTKEQITEEAVRECGGYHVRAGTLLLSFKLSLGKIGFAGRDMFTNEAIAALRIQDPRRVHREYLYHVLSSLDLSKSSDRAVLGATLNKGKLAELQFPLPAYPEQERIATLLDQAESLRKKRQEAIQLVDEFLRALFYERCGDPVTNSLALPERQVSEIGTVTTGNTPPRDVEANFGDQIEWIKSDNINTPSHVLTQAREGLSERGASVGRIVPAGSVLMTCIAGSPSVIGNVALADRRVAFNQQINAVTPFPDIEPEFLYTLLLFSKPRIQAASTKSMKGMVSKGALEKVRLIWPAADVQREVAILFRKVKALTKKMEDADPLPLLAALQKKLLA